MSVTMEALVAEIYSRDEEMPTSIIGIDGVLDDGKRVVVKVIFSDSQGEISFRHPITVKAVVDGICRAAKRRM